jgi:hypothetical protein
MSRVIRGWQKELGFDAVPFISVFREFSKPGSVVDMLGACVHREQPNPPNRLDRLAKDYPSDRINQTIATIVPTTIKTTAAMIPITHSQSFNPARRVPVAA